MNDGTAIETGRTGRIVYTRVKPNEDLVLGIEKVCLREGLWRGFIRGSLGSLTDACVTVAEGRERLLRGPAVEVVGLSGEIRPDASGNPVASLSGLLCAPDGTMAGGRFVRGQNPVCVTFELVIEEWLVDGIGVVAEIREGVDGQAA